MHSAASAPIHCIASSISVDEAIYAGAAATATGAGAAFTGTPCASPRRPGPTASPTPSPRSRCRSQQRPPPRAPRRRTRRTRRGRQRQVVQRQATEQVVHHRLRDQDVGVVGHAGRVEAHVGVLGDERLQRHPVDRPIETDAEKATSMKPAGGQSCLLILMKASPSEPWSCSPAVV
jgi:hypothetical protein